MHPMAACQGSAHKPMNALQQDIQRGCSAAALLNGITVVKCKDPLRSLLRQHDSVQTCRHHEDMPPPCAQWCEHQLRRVAGLMQLHNHMHLHTTTTCCDGVQPTHSSTLQCVDRHLWQERHKPHKAPHKQANTHIYPVPPAYTALNAVHTHCDALLMSADGSIQYTTQKHLSWLFNAGAQQPSKPQRA
jgi:hypothetical protein